jgi:hypothetical protein
MVGLLVGTVLGGGAMFFVQRHVNAGDAARREVVLEAIPKLEKFKRAITPLDWGTLMSLEDRERSKRFHSVVTATIARWDSLDESSDLIQLKMRMSFDTVTASDFSELLYELGLFRDDVVSAGFEKSIGQKEVLLADTSANNYFTLLADRAEIMRSKISNFETRLLKAM